MTETSNSDKTPGAEGDAASQASRRAGDGAAELFPRPQQGGRGREGEATGFGPGEAPPPPAAPAAPPPHRKPISLTPSGRRCAGGIAPGHASSAQDGSRSADAYGRAARCARPRAFGRPRPRGRGSPPPGGGRCRPSRPRGARARRARSRRNAQARRGAAPRAGGRLPRQSEEEARRRLSGGEPAPSPAPAAQGPRSSAAPAAPAQARPAAGPPARPPADR